MDMDVRIMPEETEDLTEINEALDPDHVDTNHVLDYDHVSSSDHVLDSDHMMDTDHLEMHAAILEGQEERFLAPEDLSDIEEEHFG